MKAYYFIDDWMLDSYHDVVRRFGQPKQMPVEPVTEINSYASVIRDPERGCYRSWYTRYFTVEGKQAAAKCLAESEDGFRWEPVKLEKPVDRLGHIQSNIVFSGHTSASEAGVIYDPRDTDSARRYKLTNSDRITLKSKQGEGKGEGEGYLSLGLAAHSPDGVHWRIDDEHPFYTVPGGTDTMLVPLFNPVTGRYQVVVRPSVLDRRIAIVESEDFRHWTQPLTVFTPEPLDEPCLQFYGMPWFYYEDLFIGLLWDHHISQDELMGGAKWSGLVDCELVYSYNGVHWNRTNRQPFIGRTEAGTYGCGSIYPHSLLVDEDNQIRIYSNGSLVDHCLEKPPIGFESVAAMIVHRLRQDGFAYLEPRAGWGTVTMRSLLPRSGEIRINFRAPVGQVLVQISDQDRKPVPGYRFEDCVPLTGDELAAHPHWKEREDASRLVGEHVRLEFRLFQAELYGVRWDSQPWYGDLPIERI